MCGIQVGAEELETILINQGPDVTEEAAASACGIQVGAEELTAVLANRTAAQKADAACGIQIGAPADALKNKALPES
jgi:hypothetical protein